MISPKEKAGKLISRFVVLGFTLCSSRECALVVVDELINDTDASSPFENERLIYLNEVKKEIEKI